MTRALAWHVATGALSLVLLWRVINVNAVLHDENGGARLPSPQIAAFGEAADDRELLRSVLRENPAQPAALLLVARDAEQRERFDEAARAYAAAYQLAPLDRDVLQAAGAFHLARGKVDEALVLVGRLAEHHPETRERVFPVIAEALASRSTSPALDAILATQPEWVGPFIISSCRRGVDPAVLVPLFLKRVAAGSARPAETDCLVTRLRGAGRWDEAYQVWLNTLPDDRLNEVGFIFNGGFEFEPSAVGFDWIPTRMAEREAGHAVDLARPTGGTGKRSLKVGYNGKRQVGIPIAQYLALPPGRYEVGGIGRSDSMRVGRGVQWTIRCMADGAAGAMVAGSERFTGSSEWRPFRFEVDIGPRCGGQILQLEPVVSGEGPVYLTGAVWFDDLAARRIQ